MLFSSALVSEAEQASQHFLLSLAVGAGTIDSSFTGRRTAMPLHDWTRVEGGIFHDFHVAWIPEIRKILNGDLLPEGYYALAEQHAGRAIADVLTLHASSAGQEPPARLPLPPATGGTVVSLPLKIRENLDKRCGVD